MWEIELLIEGEFFNIYAIKKLGSKNFEAQKIIKKVFPDKKQQKQVLDCFLRYFKRIADKGYIHNKEQFRQVQGNIYEFKCKGIRIMCFIRKRTIYLLHAFKKEGQKTPKKEIKKAEQLIKQISQYWEVNNG